MTRAVDDCHALIEVIALPDERGGWKIEHLTERSIFEANTGIDPVWLACEMGLCVGSGDTTPLFQGELFGHYSNLPFLLIRI